MEKPIRPKKTIVSNPIKPQKTKTVNCSVYSSEFSDEEFVLEDREIDGKREEIFNDYREEYDLQSLYEVDLFVQGSVNGNHLLQFCEKYGIGIKDIVCINAIDNYYGREYSNIHANIEIPNSEYEAALRTYEEEISSLKDRKDEAKKQYQSDLEKYKVEKAKYDIWVAQEKLKEVQKKAMK